MFQLISKHVKSNHIHLVSESKVRIDKKIKREGLSDKLHENIAGKENTYFNVLAILTFRNSTSI